MAASRRFMGRETEASLQLDCAMSLRTGSGQNSQSAESRTVSAPPAEARGTDAGAGEAGFCVAKGNGLGATGLGGVVGTTGVALGAAARAGALSFDLKTPEMSSGTSTCVCPERRANSAGFMAAKILANGRSTHVSSRLASSAKVPGGADWRSSAKRIRTAPEGSCAKAVLTGSGKTPVADDETSGAREAGNRATMSLNGTGMTSAWGCMAGGDFGSGGAGNAGTGCAGTGAGGEKSRLKKSNMQRSG